MDILIAILIPLVFLLSGVRIVHQQNIAIIETFGRFTRTCGPGLTWVFPIVQQVAARMDLRVVEIKDKVDVKTADNSFVMMPVSLMVRVVEDRAEDAFYKLANPTNQVKTWAMNTFRSAAAGMTLNDLYTDRDVLEAAITTTLAERLDGYGYQIDGVLVDQPTLEASVQNSFNRVVASKRELEAAHQEAESVRVRMVGEAKAEAESQKLRAEGLAEARTILAESLSKAISDAVKGSGGIEKDDIMHLLLETNRLDAIRASAEHGKLVVMDLRGNDPTGRPVLPI